MLTSRRFRDTLVASLSTVVLLFLLASCSQRERTPGHLYLRLNTNPTTLDPAYIVDVQGGGIGAKLFNGLVRLDESLKIIPDIAKKWTVTDMGRTYTFYLREGIRFSNGREVTAGDFKYSFERVLDRRVLSPVSWVFEKVLGAKEYTGGGAEEVSGISVLDRHTLMIRLTEPFSPFLYLLTMTAAYVVPEEEVRRQGREFGSHPTGTGPFVIRSWRHNSEIVLARNSSYFDAPPKVEGIIYRIIPEDLTAVTEFELGNIDLISVPASDYSRFRTSERWRGLVALMNGLNTYYLGFNCSRPPFDDPRLRRAVAYAIDRRKVLETYYERRGRQASGPIPDMLRHWPDPVMPEYDPSRARELVREIGAEGRSIDFYISSDPEIVDIAEIIQFYLSRTGLAVSIKKLEWSAYKAALNNGEADMFWLSWWADYPDPENYLFPLFHSSNHGASGNRTRYTNKEVDSLIDAGRRSMDEAERDRYYMSAERTIAEELPWLPFWHKSEVTVRQSTLKNYRLYPIYSIDKGLEVSF